MTDELAPIITRIQQHIHTNPDGCWIWTAATDNRDHPCIKIAGRTQRVRRITWQLTHGPLHSTERIRTICSRTRCVNPNHMLVIPPKAA